MMKRARLRYPLLLLFLLLPAAALAEAATPPDIAYLLAVQSFRENAGALLTGIMRGFTTLGEAAVPLIIGALLYWTLDKRAGLYLLFSNAYGHIVNQLMKVSFCIYRPWIRDPRIQPVASAITTATGYSFPSGHVANSGAALYGVAAWLRSRLKRKGAKLAVSVVCGFVWLMVAFSRNFLGVHTPQDVVVMLVLMLLILWIVRKVLDAAEAHANGDVVLSAVGVLVSIALAVYASVKSYPMDEVNGVLLVDPAKMVVDCFSTAGMLLGLSIGYLAERRQVRFQLNARPMALVLRGVVGVVVTLLVYTLLGSVLKSLLGSLWGHFAVAAILSLYVLYLHPLCFTQWEKRMVKPAAAA